MTATIQKIMSKKLITVKSGTLLVDAQLLMKEKRIRHLPVVDSTTHEIIGMLSDRFQILSNLVSGLEVDAVMTSPIVAVSHNTPLRKTLFQFLENKISAVLITDEKNEAVGIITTDDVIWHLAHLIKDKDSEEFHFLTAESKITIGELANQMAHSGI